MGLTLRGVYDDSHPEDGSHDPATVPRAGRMVDPASPSAGPGATGGSAEELLLRSLREGDEQAFASLVERLHASMLRLARIYVRTEAVATEVIQETWLAVLRGLGKFEGRSSLKTWIFQILINRARTRAVRESRYVSLDQMTELRPDSFEPAVDPARFASGSGSWVVPPRRWGADQEAALLTKEARGCVDREIQLLPPLQRAVITLRDIDQWTSRDVCLLLDLSENYQRVLLHRARARVRKACEDFLEKRFA